MGGGDGVAPEAYATRHVGGHRVRGDTVELPGGSHIHPHGAWEPAEGKDRTVVLSWNGMSLITKLVSKERRMGNGTKAKGIKRPRIKKDQKRNMVRPRVKVVFR